MTSTTTMKRCLRCEKLLPLEAFGPSKRNRDGHRNTCRMCNAERNRQRYKAKMLGSKPPELKPIKKHEPKEKPAEKTHRLRKGVTCAFHCAEYPCFTGINNMSSNLALTCHKFRQRV